MKKLIPLLFFLFPIFARAQSGFCFSTTVSTTYNLTGYNGITISGKSFNASGSILIHLTNCHDIHITKCKVWNTTTYGIRMDNCYNITIDSCDFNNLATGVYAFGCTGGIVVKNNQFYNMHNNASGPNSHAIQFNTCNGAGLIAYNKIETPPTPYTGDIINLYKSNGLDNTHRIRVVGNWIRGGGTLTGSLGPAGIVGGDLGGSYQTIDSNILVNTGYVGQQTQGGTHINVRYNKIYSANLPYSGLGLGCANYSGVIPAGVGDTIGYNQINWYAGFLGYQRDTAYKSANSNSKPALWTTNSVYPATASTITAAILPPVIYDQCISPNITYSPSSETGTYHFALIPLVPTNTGGAITSYTISPSLPSGVSIDATTGIISGTPLAVQTSTTYTVTAHGASGNGTAPISLTVNPAPLQLIANSFNRPFNSAIPTYTYTAIGLF